MPFSIDANRCKHDARSKLIERCAIMPQWAFDIFVNNILSFLSVVSFVFVVPLFPKEWIFGKFRKTSITRCMIFSFYIHVCIYINVKRREIVDCILFDFLSLLFLFSFTFLLYDILVVSRRSRWTRLCLLAFVAFSFLFNIFSPFYS